MLGTQGSSQGEQPWAGRRNTFGVKKDGSEGRVQPSGEWGSLREKSPGGGSPRGRAILDGPLVLIGVLLAALASSVPLPAEEDVAQTADFRIEDFLGRSWRNESVRFDLSPEQAAHVVAGHPLLGSGRKPVAYQVIPGRDGKPGAIEFLLDLDPFQARGFQFSDGAARAATDLAVEETPELIRLTNGHTGIAIARQLADGNGPVAAVRLNSGRWVAGSSFSAPGAGAQYSAEVTARGPVFAEAICRIGVGEGKEWEIRFRIEAGEPVVVVHEKFGLGKGAAWTVSLGRDFGPDHLLYRYGKGLPGNANAVGRYNRWKIEPGTPEPPFTWVPWLPWWERVRENTWFALYREDSSDLLGIGALNPSLWTTPEQHAQGRGMPRVPVTLNNSELSMRLPLEEGERRWMLCALPRGESVSLLDEKRPYLAPPPQQYLIKHGDFPLDLVKDYVLDWEADLEGHPRLFLTREQVAEFRKHFKSDPAELRSLIKSPVRPHSMEPHIKHYLGTGNQELGLHLAKTAVGMVQGSVDMYLKQDHLVTLGFAPHHQTRVLVGANLTDAILSGGLMEPKVRRRVFAQLAFLGYTVCRSDYWDPRRGYCANPNMTSTVAAYQAVLAGIIPRHPKAREWMDRAMAELKDKELDTWSDENGGWLEAPHYAMVSYDYLLGCFLMAHNAGFNDYLYHPRMKKVIEWFAKISTPPDSRLKGWRHKPPIGNTYISEPCGAFATVAYLWKDRDPEFAAQMQWMWEQHGRYPSPGIGGFYPTLAGYRTLLQAPHLTAKAPAYGSELFPETGVVLRNAYPGDRETYLHMIAGRHHDHYDRDSGSVTLWGKGRIVADDFGYTGYGSGEDHSLLESAGAPSEAKMKVVDFATTDGLDYVRGVKGNWTRQIAFVKDADPLGPNYFVFCDSLKKPEPATWRLWCTAEKVQLRQKGALVIGREDVDTDVFFTHPKSPVLRTAEKSCSSHGMTSELRQMRMTTTQLGVLADLKKGRGLSVLVYPRLKKQKPPIVASLDGGRVFKVTTEVGADYVFLSPGRFTFQQDTISFEGTSGAIRMRGPHLTLSLGAVGRVSARGQTLEGVEAAIRHVP